MVRIEFPSNGDYVTEDNQKLGEVLPIYMHSDQEIMLIDKTNELILSVLTDKMLNIALDKYGHRLVLRDSKRLSRRVIMIGNAVPNDQYEDYVTFLR